VRAQDDHFSATKTLSLGDGRPAKTHPEEIRAGGIPNDLIERKKQGFGLPVYEWFTDRWATILVGSCPRFVTDPIFWIAMQCCGWRKTVNAAPLLGICSSPSGGRNT